MSLKIWYVAAVFFTLFACDGGTQTTPGKGAATDAATQPTSTGQSAVFKAMYMDATCALYVRCGISKDTTDCRKNHFEAGPQSIDTIADDIDQGIVLFDSANAAPCFEAITNLPCTIPDLTDIRTKESCAPILRGTLPLQAPCVQGLECANGWCEKNSGCTGCCAGVCSPPKSSAAVGAACKSSRECEEGAYCDVSTGSTGPYFCRTRLAMGAACTLSIACPSGAECAGESGTRTCQVQPRIGEPCSKTGPKCNSMGSYCDGSTRTCRPGNQSGQPCPSTALTITSNEGCALYARCQSGVCEAIPGIGEACTVPPDSTVTAYSVCRAGMCEANLCSPRTDPLCTLRTANRPDAAP